MRPALVIIAMAAAASPAHAEPISLTVATLAAALPSASTALVTIGATTVLTVGQAVGFAVTAALSIGASLLASRQSGKTAVDTEQAKTVFETGDSPEMRVVGRARIGGLRVFGNTDSVNRFRLVAHCKGEIGGYEEYFLGGRSVVVESNGAVSSRPYAGYVFANSKVGSAALETAWSVLQSSFSALWTVTHRVQGLAQTLVQYVSPGFDEVLFAKLYQGGEPPLEVIIRGEKVYDPRNELTYWTDNAVLVMMHVLRSMPEYGLQKFDLDAIRAEADKADELVETRTGTERRARLAGVWTSEIERGSLIEQLLASAGADIRWTIDGKLAIELINDSARPVEFAFSEQDIVDVEWRPGPEQVERPNICVIKYYSSERNHEVVEIDMSGVSWARAQPEIDRFGPKPVTYELNFCPSAAQAQRIARRLFLRARGESGVLTTNMVGIAAWGLRCVTFPMPDIGVVKQVDVLAARINDDAGTVDIPFVGGAPLSTWVPANDEALPPSVLPELSYQSGLTQPTPITNAIVITYPDTTQETRATFVRTGDAAGGVNGFELAYRLLAGVDQPTPWSGMTQYSVTGFDMGYLPLSIAAQTADFRVRAYNASEDSSQWSPTTRVVMSADTLAPSAPILTPTVLEIDGEGNADSVRIDVAVPAQLRVAYLVLTGPNSPGTVNVRPGQAIQWTYDVPLPVGTTTTYTWTATLHASGGAASATQTVTVTVNPPL